MREFTVDKVFQKDLADYQILQEIGCGSDATVFLARDKSNREVAIKVIDKALQSPEGLQRTKQEIDIMKDLDHPNITKLYHAFDTDERRYIVTEYAGGGDLFEALYSLELNPSQTVMRESVARKIFAQAASAIKYCHEHNICHRDLKPENIFLDTKFNVKLGDFGLAMRFKPNRYVMQPVGSLLYAAPEILQHDPYMGPELDVWGLGILLYEMLCGTPPFHAETEQEICDKILGGDYAIPNYVSPKAQSLISGMIKLKQWRMTLDEVLQHPWMRGTRKAITIHPSPEKKRKSRARKSEDEAKIEIDNQESGEIPLLEEAGAASSPKASSSNDKPKRTVGRRLFEEEEEGAAAAALPATLDEDESGTDLSSRENSGGGLTALSRETSLSSSSCSGAESGTESDAVEIRRGQPMERAATPPPPMPPLLLFLDDEWPSPREPHSIDHPRLRERFNMGSPRSRSLPFLYKAQQQPPQTPSGKT